MEKQKKTKRGVSIKWKLIILLMCFSAALIILLWLFQVVFLDSFYKSIKVNSIRSCVNQIEKADYYGMDSELIWTLAGENDSCIMLLDRDNTLDIVTLKLGYTDSRSFTDLFKKITGMTPVEYKHTQN